MENNEKDGVADAVFNTAKPLKKKHKLLWTIVIIVVIFYLLSVIGNDSSSDDQDNLRIEQSYTLDEMESRCIKFNYKDVARNPDDYMGECFKVNIYIDEVINESVKSGSDKCYKAYIYNKKEESQDYDKFLWLYDFQVGDDKLKILDGDVIQAYVIFNGMGDSENSLTGEKSEDMALDLHYANLIKE